MILSVDDTNSIAFCAGSIRAGRLLGLPTETVYGLAADADNDAAVAQIFVAKGRPADHPLIVHVANTTAAAHYAASIPGFAAALMTAFWPGPLTLILPRKPGLATAATGGHDSIGLRCPAHPVALALLNQLLNGVANNGGQNPMESDPDYLGAVVWGLAAPSANKFGRVSPTTAQHVADEFGDDLRVLDGGPCRVGIESTIIDCTRGVPVLLRPGAVTSMQVEAACGLKVLLKDELPAQIAPAPKASGTLESHYAPRARVRLMDAASLQAAMRELQTSIGVMAGELASASKSAPLGKAPGLAVWARTPLPTLEVGIIARAMPQDAAAAAQQLFATLRALDAQGVSQIWVEAPPPDANWDGVRDRLQRAAH